MIETHSKILRTAVLAACTALMITMTTVIMASPAFADAKSDLDQANQTASEASSAYDEAKAHADEINAAIEEKTTQIADLEQNQLPKVEAEYGAALRQMYMGGADPLAIISSIFAGENLHEVFAIIEAFDHIADWRESAYLDVRDTRNEIAQAKETLEAEKVEADAALADAEAKKQEALEAQTAARAAYQATLPQNIPTTRRAATSSTFYDEASARAFIVMKESGGNYNARNGRYVGAYQLTNTYLNGDYSPENQDRVAEQYVRNRYGSWMNAANFWVSHGWY